MDIDDLIRETEREIEATEAKQFRAQMLEKFARREIIKGDATDQELGALQQSLGILNKSVKRQKKYLEFLKEETQTPASTS